MIELGDDLVDVMGVLAEAAQRHRVMISITISPYDEDDDDDEDDGQVHYQDERRDGAALAALRAERAP